MSFSEESISILKRTRATYLEEVEELIKSLDDLILSGRTETVDDVKKERERLHLISTQFYEAHQRCMEAIEDPDRRGTLQIHYDSQRTKIDSVLAKASQWLAVTTGPESGKLAFMDTGSVAGSASSESVRQRIREMREKRALAEVNARNLEEQLRLERREEELAREKAEIQRSLKSLKQKKELQQIALQQSLLNEELHEDHPIGAIPKIDGVFDDLPRTSLPPDRALPYQSSTPTAQEDTLTRLTMSLRLPKPELLTFDGHPTNFCKFMTNFDSHIANSVHDDGLKLSYLIQYCTGEAKYSIEDCVLLGPKEGYKRAREILYSSYGRPHLISRSHIEILTSGPPLKPNDIVGLATLSRNMTRCELTLSQIGFESNINNSDNIRKIARRLPSHLRSKWIDLAYQIQESGREPSFLDLSRFVDERSRVANSIYGQDFALDDRNQIKDPHRSERVKIDHATIFPVESERSGPRLIVGQPCIFCGNDCSNLGCCTKFSSLSLERRKSFVRERRLCYNCLRPNHIVRYCRRASECTVSRCTFKHHPLLHSWAPSSIHTSVNCAATKGVFKRTCLGIIPVVVEATNGKSCKTYALLDNGADKTLCSEGLMSRLGVLGKPISFNMSTVNSKGTITHGREINLIAKPTHECSDGVYLNRVWSVSQLPINASLAMDKREMKKWSHLSDIASCIPEIASKDVTLLIGTDSPAAHVPLEVRSGSGTEPYAVRTLLGWTVRGPTSSSTDVNSASINFHRSTDVTLEQQLERLWKSEFNENSLSERSSWSIEDKRAHRVMEQSVHMEEGHYKIALPWRDANLNLPNNLPLAHIRLKHLKKKLVQDGALHRMYTETVSDYISKGYAKEVDGTANGLERVWYLPHHPIQTENKPGKVRVVFDCAAKYMSTSLNENLLQGPDFTNSLIEVLIRFRQGAVAIAADVEAMFHQVRVRDEDQDVLRFLWWPDGDMSQQPKHYRMQVHLFGATSSPSIAGYALKKTAHDNIDKFSQQAVRSVERNFYVDDLLKSVDTMEEAITLVCEISALLSRGGFRLTKWISNDKGVIASIPKSELSQSLKNIAIDDALPIQRALGIIWNVEEDVIEFSIRTREAPLTRRGILSAVSTLFDPLGLVAPVTLKAKLILQSLCREGLAWDDDIPVEYKDVWQRWLADLSKLERVQIKRCCRRRDAAVTGCTQLHIFSDASETGYGACAYLRTVEDNGTINCALVIGKSRLAPIRQISIPRLELSAAATACNLLRILHHALEIEIDQTYLWTDSNIVLGYINNENRRFKTFVANRLTMIHELSSPSQWGHVNSRSNPADLASRGFNAGDDEAMQIWLNGPKFLWQEQTSWPKPKDAIELKDDDPELKKETIFIAVMTETEGLDKLFSMYSDWQRLCRAVVWLLRFVNYCQVKYRKHGILTRVGDMTVDELKVAKESIVSYVQYTCFKEEWEKLTHNEQVKRSSKLASLNPVLDGKIMKGAGRLSISKLGDDTIAPVLLPTKHHVSNLIIQHYHKLNGHVGTSQVLSVIRQEFWIIKGRATVKNVLGNCIDCKRRDARPCQQQMAPLLEEQVTPDHPPFTYVGVDYFGPLLVKFGRSQSKRYGCLFTCLTSRAVHIEIAHSLTTDSFIAAFHRFISRRGTPKKVFSDNGTNFTSAEKEMKEYVKSWNQSQINRSMLQRDIQWHFNPPHASHMGGSWERMIKMTRHILRGLVKQQLLTDEQLMTVMAEAEKIMNDRPITYVSSDIDDPEPLTPNKLLLLRTNSCVPPGTFDKDDRYARRWWRQAQYIADVFWKRWTREYLPSLQVRQIWQRKTRNLRKNDLVLVIDHSTPRGKWPLAVVDKVTFGRDGNVRSCRVRHANKTWVRPITSLCLLEASG